jgi:hypothetical protein
MYAFIGYSYGNVYEDVNLSDNQNYFYKIVPIDNNGQIYDVNLASLEALVTPRSSKDMTKEELVFVVPQVFVNATSSLAAYTTQVAGVVDVINFIYSKNTKKTFVLKAVLPYDIQALCDFTQASSWQCSKVTNNKNFYLPGAISVFYLPFASNSPIVAATIALGAGIPLSVLRNYSILYQINNNPPTFDPKIIVDLNSNDYVEVEILAHELGHTYGIGTPELYSYINKSDQTGVAPIIEHTAFSSFTFIPPAYMNDLMAYYQPIKDSMFGPVNSFIIDANPAHISNRNYQGSRGFSNTIKIKVSDASSSALNPAPLSGAEVKVFCAAVDLRQLAETSPRYTFFTDANGQALLQQLSTESWGGRSSLYGGIFDDGCTINLLKIYKAGYSSKVIFQTSLQLLETKVLNGIEDYTIEAQLSR